MKITLDICYPFALSFSDAMMTKTMHGRHHHCQLGVLVCIKINSNFIKEKKI